MWFVGGVAAEGAEDAGATDKDQEGVAVIEAYLGERIDVSSRKNATNAHLHQ